MPEPGVTPVSGPCASEGIVTLLKPTGDEPANLGSGGSPGRRIPPGLATLAAQFPGLRVEEMLRHDGKSLVAAGHAGDQPVVIKVLADGDPSWRHRQRHEIGVYQIFAEHPPPVRVPRLVHTDGYRIVVMERLEGATLGTGRYPRVLTAPEVRAAVRLVGRLHGWQPLPHGFQPVFAYHKRIARYHAAGYFAEDDRRALERLLARCGQPRQLNHGDPLPGNMVLLPSGEWALLDLEFTGLFLPGFDLAMLSVLLAGTPGAAALLEDVVRWTGAEEAYLVNLAVVLSRERRIHLTLPEDHPLRLARLPAIDAAWARARERLWAAAGRRLFAPAGR
jgi:aminoglycoside phosphotransferase (APT) family kinase protein